MDANKAHGMEITVNGKQRELKAPMSLTALLKELNIAATHLAVELNGEIIDRETDWNVIQIRPGDTLEIVKFLGGG